MTGCLGLDFNVQCREQILSSFVIGPANGKASNKNDNLLAGPSLISPNRIAIHSFVYMHLGYSSLQSFLSSYLDSDVFVCLCLIPVFPFSSFSYHLLNLLPSFPFMASCLGVLASSCLPICSGNRIPCGRKSRAKGRATNISAN